MVTYFCRNCWKEIDEEERVCPYCGTEQDKLNTETFVQKLIRALRHNEPETPIRAAYILGKIKAREAIPFLWEIVEHNEDPFLVAAATEALSEFEEVNIEQIQTLLAHRSSVPVRSVIERITKRRNT